MDLTSLQALRADQAGVVSRRQLERLGATKADIDRLLRRRLLVRQLPGVYVDHTGEPTWLQRAWAGVLYAWPAALSHGSAVRAAMGPGWRRHRDDSPIRVVVAAHRRVVEPTGYRVHRSRGFADQVQSNTGPPRVRLDDAALTMASEAASEFDAIAILTDLVQSRRTTAPRLLRRLRDRPRLAGSPWLGAVLTDVAEGTCSVLEHGYLTRVERAHGLPRPRRQKAERLAGSSVERDVEYEPFGLVVELDGRLFHDSAGQRDRDLDRDLDAAVDGRETVRLSWGQVFDRPCGTAGRIGLLLRRRGWGGVPRACGPDCGLVTTIAIPAT